jgi:hypothetical protein
MSNSLFTIALMIGYVGLSRVFNWSTESLWGLALLFVAFAFLILREAFPNYFGVLNARVNVIQYQQRMIKRKNHEIEKMKLALREMNEELRGVHALWMNSKSVNSPAVARAKISTQVTKTIESILSTQNWNLMATNAELSDEEKSIIASRIIQQVLPVSNFKNYSIAEASKVSPASQDVIEQQDRFENLRQETFIIENAMFESTPSENAIIENESRPFYQIGSI